MDLQKRWMNLLIVVEAALLVVVLGFGLFLYGSRRSEQNQKTDGQDSTSDVVQQDTTQENPEESKPQFSEQVISLMENMTLEEKAAQLFIITPEALTGADRVTVARTVSQDAIKKYPVGGLVFAMTNYTGSRQFQALINGYQGFSESVLGVRLFIVGNDLSDDAVRQGVNMNLADIPVPVSLDAAAVEALRAEKGQQALILSGDLSAENITSVYTDGQEVVEAVKAGVDLLYNPADFKTAYEALVTAVSSGEIEAAVLENAVGRILTMKLR